MPWQPSATVFSVVRRVTWIVGSPLLLLAAVADLAFGPVAGKYKIASAYRLLARRVDLSDPANAARLREEVRELQFQ